MSSQDINLLVEMGFTKLRAERALEVTGNKGVEPAMEWLLAHVDDTILPNINVETPHSSDPTLVLTESKKEPGNTPPSDDKSEEDNLDVTPVVNVDAGAEAKSLKCEDCGRLFKNQSEVEFHAAKSGHMNFSESTEEKKPLTDEEKKEQLRMLEEKMKQKRLEREQNEKAEALEREKLRIKSGKEMVAAKKKFEDAEMKKILDQRKREKMEEKVARERVKNQIEQDKLARKAKFSPGQEVPVVPMETKPATLPTSQPKSDYTQTRLQIRLTNGQSLTQTFGTKEQLSAVRLYVEMNRTDGEGAFSLMTTFPKKVFDEEDYEKPLDALGLIPAAVIIVSRVVPPNNQ